MFTKKDDVAVLDKLGTPRLSSARSANACAPSSAIARRFPHS